MKFNRILAMIVTCLMVAGAMVIGLQGKPVSRDDSLYLTDKAGVISDSGEIQFAALQRELSPRLSVAIVKSTGKMSTAQYCETLWNNWHLGTSDLLLLMVTGEEDYYFGYDYSSLFAEVLDANFDLLMEQYLEPDFAARDYESAIFAFSDGIQQVLSGAYFNNGTLNSGEYYGEYTSTSAGTVFLLAMVIIVLVLAVIAVNSIGKKRPGTTVYHKPSAPGSYKPSGTSYRPSSTPRPGTSYRPSSTVRPSGTSFRPTVRPSSRPSRPGGFGGGGRSSGGFGGGGRSSGGRSMGGGGRSGGMGGRGRR